MKPARQAGIDAWVSLVGEDQRTTLARVYGAGAVMPSEIAARFGVQPETVRDYLKAFAPNDLLALAARGTQGLVEHWLRHYRGDAKDKPVFAEQARALLAMEFGALPLFALLVERHRRRARSGEPLELRKIARLSRKGYEAIRYAQEESVAARRDRGQAGPDKQIRALVRLGSGADFENGGETLAPFALEVYALDRPALRLIETTAARLRVSLWYDRQRWPAANMPRLTGLLQRRKWPCRRPRGLFGPPMGPIDFAAVFRVASVIAQAGVPRGAIPREALDNAACVVAKGYLLAAGLERLDWSKKSAATAPFNMFCQALRDAYEIDIFQSFKTGRVFVGPPSR